MKQKSGQISFTTSIDDKDQVVMNLDSDSALHPRSTRFI